MLQRQQQIEYVLGKPTGRPSVDRSIDRACKKFLLRAMKARRKILTARFGGMQCAWKIGSA